MGAQFGAPNGLFAAANSGAGFYRINLTDGTWTRISSVPSSSVNDGANCPSMPVQFPADLVLSKTSATSVYAPGSDVTYTIAVTNNGPYDAFGAEVSDPLPAGVTAASWTCVATGTATCTASGSGAISDTVNLPAGSGNSVTYTLKLSLPTNATGDLVNTATVKSPAYVNDPNAGNNTSTVTHASPSTADLGITKSGSTIYTPGGTIVYTLVVTNKGPAAVQGATVSDPLPAGITDATWSCAPGAGASCTASGTGGINDTAVNLPLNGSVTYTSTVSVPVNFKGSLVNTATVAPPAGLTDPNAGDNTATQTATSSTRTPSVVDLQIVKSSNGSYTPGSDKVYSIVVTNHGPDAATGVTVSDPLPASVTAASWSCTAGAGASCTGSGSGAIYDTAVNLPSGSSVTYSLTLNVPASYTGDLVNKADATLPADFIDTAPENNSSTDVSKLATQMPPANVPVNSGWMLLMLVALLGWQATRSKTS